MLKKQLKYIGFVLALICAVAFTYAQGISPKRAQADRLFDRAEYFKAVEIYLNLPESSSFEVMERIADCYRLMNNYEEAETWYGRLASMKNIRPDDLIYYADLLLRNNKIDKAREQYLRYFQTNGTKDQMAFKLAVCDSAAAWVRREGNYKVKDEKGVNSNYSDWGPGYYGKNAIVFTSDRFTGNQKGNKAIYNRTGNEWLKLFSYDLKGGDTQELKFANTDELNLSKDYHTGPMAVNAAADTGYITVTTRVGKGSLTNFKTPYDERIYIRRLELMMAVKKKDQWGNFARFPYNEVSKYSVAHAALSKDGQLLYFTSDMPGGYGKTDIWFCRKDAKGKWSKPENCGKNINTADDEAFPSIGGDGKLYFASRGLPGMGGYDIFSASGSGPNWGKPVNLRYPLNSTSDDFSFITNDGLSGFFSSDRQGGQGSDDIYSFSFTGRDNILQLAGATTTVPPADRDNTAMAMSAAPMIPPAANIPAVVAVAGPLFALNGSVFDSNGGQAVDSVTVVLKNATGQTVDGALVLANGKFSFNVPSGQDYTVEARKQGYYPASQRVPAGAPGADLKLAMESLEIGKTFIIRTIYYDLNRATIRPDAITELDKLVAIMRDNPSLKIELSSHTDSRGPDYYNMLLSQARATSAVAYMRRRGIVATRMVAKGYGETHLLNKCGNGVRCTEDEHQFNRRTEFKVTGGNFKPELSVKK